MAFTWYQADSSPTVVGPPPSHPCLLQNVTLRYLKPDDLEEVRTLCRDWFPIEYPLSWYKDITSSERFFALAAVHQGVIIGLIVAEIKPYLKLNAEDRGILPGWFGSNNNTLVGYILSLGVARSHRRAGVGSLLLETLISHVAGPTPVPPYHHRVKALFLHVLLSNSEAILFYEQRKFRLHSFLPYYYLIKGHCKDGFTYVYYINGGHPPWGIYDYVKYWAGVALSGGGVCPWIWGKLRSALSLAWHH